MVSDDKTVFSQYVKENQLYTIQDGGRSLLDEEKKAVSFIIDDKGVCHTCKLGEVIYGCDVATYDILVEKSNECVNTLSIESSIYIEVERKERIHQDIPFVIRTLDHPEKDYYIPSYMEQIMEAKENEDLVSCLYVSGTLMVVPCNVTVIRSNQTKEMSISVDDQLLYQSKMIWQDDVSGEETESDVNKVIDSKDNNESEDAITDEIEDESEDAVTDEIEDDQIKVMTGVAYQPASISGLQPPKSTQPMGTDITSGTEFSKEKSHLSNVVDELRKQIRRIQAKPYYTGKYATVRGGDDGTEYSQLSSYKEHSEHDRREIDEIREMIDIPYRYRVDIQEAGRIVTYYLGPVEINGMSSGYNVLSFNSPKGKKLATYNAHDDEINRRIELRRDLTINHSNLKKYRNLMVKSAQSDYSKIFRNRLTDPFLIQVLQMRRQDHNISDIIVTIQKNQNVIVDAPVKQDMIIQGCAGSGKTMVMMHRLSRLQNWVHAFDPKEVLILTPSNQYEFYIKAVTEGLAIRNIQQSTIEQYYVELLSEYDKEFRIKKDIISDFKMNDKMLGFIYSDSFINEFDKNFDVCIAKRRELTDELKSLCEKTDTSVAEEVPKQEKEVPDWCARTYERLQTKVSWMEQEITKKESDIAAIMKRKDDLDREIIPEWKTKLSAQLQDSWNQAIVLVSNVSDNNQREFLDELIKDHLDDASEEQIQLLLYKMQRWLPEVSDLIEVCEKTEGQLNDYIKESRDKVKAIENATNELALLRSQEISSQIKNDIRLLEEQIKETSHMVLFRKVFAETTADICQELGLKRMPGTHRYDLYAMLLFCRRYFGCDYGVHSFICVDEGQDISHNEYKLIKEMNGGNVTFNVYGDTRQLIHPVRGISDWNQLKAVLNHHREYSLNENYRNTNQIIQYCNQTFHMLVKNVGVDGPTVQSSTYADFLKEVANITEIHDERWAILIPRTMKKQEILKQMQQLGASALVKTDQINNDIIAIMYVDEVKGFEFDRVYYLGMDMNPNEQYIAATRALTELRFVQNKPEKR